MKVGLIGAGNWGKNIARVLNELGALGGIAEISPKILAELSLVYPEVPLYEDYRTLLETDLPGVIIATPAATHFPLAKEALLCEKHVLVEKPLALSVVEAEELVALARKQKRILMVGHLLLYQPAIRWIKDFFDSRSLGRIWSLHQERLNLGRARPIENALWSLAVHDVAVLLYLLKLPPEEVRAVGHAMLQPDVEDDVHVHIKFSGSTQAHLHASWLWPEKIRRLTIIGEGGMLVYDEVEQIVVLHRKGITPQLTNRDEGTEVVFRNYGEPLRDALTHFLQCIVQGKKPLTDGEASIPVVKVLEEASRQLEAYR